jgi:negative regulator of sigma E activity
VKKGMQEPVAVGTDVTVEDLSLGFLYWPDARLLGKENVRGRGAWKIELRPGKRGSEFAVVRVWLDEASGALLRIEGFDWQGKLLRRFEVVSGQRIDGQWMLKQMRIEKFSPENSSRPTGRSYLEILGKEDA